jgi:hypothetical protein
MYPVRFFRRDPTDVKNIDLDPIANKILNKRDTIIPDNSHLLRRSQTAKGKGAKKGDNASVKTDA